MSNNGSFHWARWLSVVVLAGAAGGGAWYVKTNHEAPAEYQTSKVAKGDLTQVVTATGQLGPVLNVQVGSQISGIVKKMFIDYNSTVKSNQVIAEIDPSTYEINVLKAQAQVANSKANQALAQIQAKRADDLFKNNLIPEADHDTAKAQLQQAEAQVQNDEATLKSAQVQLSYCTIYAPVDGVVISRNVDVGQTVAASFNTPTIAVIANDLSKMQIDALVSEADIGGVSIDQNVNFSVDAYPYRTFRGKVNQIRYGAVTNQNVINYDCVISVSNADLKLLPSMTANVSVITAEKDNVLKVPNAALRFRPPDATNAMPQMMAQGSRPGGDSARGGAGVSRGGPEGSGAGRGAGPGGPGGFAAGGGGRGERGPGGDASGANRRPRGERQVVRTVYVLPAKADPKDPESHKPKPIQIKVGISDGISTEVLDGLEEGTEVITGILSGGDALASKQGGPTANPFGGGGFRRF